MKIKWDISKIDAPGGAWMVTRDVISTEQVTQPDAPEVDATVDVVREHSVSAYTTLSWARRSIVDELRLPKRVRMTRKTAHHYTYQHTA